EESTIFEGGGRDGAQGQGSHNHRRFGRHRRRDGQTVRRRRRQSRSGRSESRGAGRGGQGAGTRSRAAFVGGGRRDQGRRRYQLRQPNEGEIRPHRRVVQQR